MNKTILLIKTPYGGNIAVIERSHLKRANDFAVGYNLKPEFHELEQEWTSDSYWSAAVSYDVRTYQEAYDLAISVAASFISILDTMAPLEKCQYAKYLNKKTDYLFNRIDYVENVYTNTKLAYNYIRKFASDEEYEKMPAEFDDLNSSRRDEILDFIFQNGRFDYFKINPGILEFDEILELVGDEAIEKLKDECLKRIL